MGTLRPDARLNHATRIRFACWAYRGARPLGYDKETPKLATEKHITLTWRRTTKWWKHSLDGPGRKRIETFEGDLRPANKGYEITDIFETAILRNRDQTYVINIHEDLLSDEPECWILIVRSREEGPDEELAVEHAPNPTEAKRQAQFRLATFLDAPTEDHLLDQTPDRTSPPARADRNRSGKKRSVRTRRYALPKA